jgi:hypothetical protein
MGAMMREDRFGVVAMSINPASVSANTTAEQDFTLPGLAVGDFVFVNKPSVTAGLSIANARVKAANTLSITFGNHTGSPIDAAAETYTIFWFHPEIITSTVNP